ncbi:MAG: membrane dipeptidase [Alphaproteobacteria bacterium]|nr:membrane dipeptidase [Alphaproteobacteria bacterium]
MLIDGLQCGHFTRETFADLKRGGVGCVTITCGFWEGPLETMDLIGRWRDFGRANEDLMAFARTGREIREIAASGRVATLVGTQNTELLSNRIGFVELFADMGLRVMQLTYNTQNSIGSSCYEPVDTGLTRFGREVVQEMNRVGILVDLSHVGNKTSLDAIEASEKPVAVTHANWASLYPHKRNKPDDVLRALKEHRGILGCATYRNITGDEYCRSVEAWAGMVARTVEMMGIDHVGIGTDRSHNHKEADYLWMRKGRWTRGGGYGASATGSLTPVAPADFFREIHQIGVIPEGLRKAGFSAEEVDKITHGNWLRIYDEVFSPGEERRAAKAA